MIAPIVRRKISHRNPISGHRPGAPLPHASAAPLLGLCSHNAGYRRGEEKPNPDHDNARAPVVLGGRQQPRERTNGKNRKGKSLSHGSQGTRIHPRSTFLRFRGVW